MSHKLTNHFESVQLLSLKDLKAAAEIPGRDRNGPYIVMQHAYDPEDPTMTPEDFLLGKSGAWLATKWFINLPVAERRQEFIFATSAEVITLLESLTRGVNVTRPTGAPPEATAEDDPLNRMVQSRAKDL
jgi:hypothetical protein